MFEMQTASIRKELAEHDFVFINGTIPMHRYPGEDDATACEVADDIKYGYLGELSEVSQYQDLLDGLIGVVQSQGPFDGIMGFSEGGIIAATLLLEDARRPYASFKCGILFSAAPPLDPDDLRQGHIRSLDPEKDGISIHIPTAHVYSHEVGTSQHVQSPLSGLWAECGWIFPEHVHSSLARLCDNAEVFVHDRGHQVPGPRDYQELRGALRAINRTIERASD
ncbi:hypothetical protein CEP54_013469 [Fusarium duplospermum]|uniref:Serine hydrolase domain-containing protein n=1 Tax=Fusarium duplospermum TaxID=1325734 RepID=A0A428P2R0_9HYPO|nr:hypothetical protein CEP54_013469 [Fusarium duplospermum]